MMVVTYRKFFALLKKRGIKQTSVVNAGVISSMTMNRMVNNKPLRTDTLCKLCEFLGVQPGDIIDCVDESKQYEPLPED